MPLEGEDVVHLLVEKSLLEFPDVPAPLLPVRRAALPLVELVGRGRIVRIYPEQGVVVGRRRVQQREALLAVRVERRRLCRNDEHQLAARARRLLRRDGRGQAGQHEPREERRRDPRHRLRATADHAVIPGRSIA